MHGDEPAGVTVVERVRAWPESAWSGCPDAVVLAIGHPAALAAGARTLPGAPDLNRAFGAAPVPGPVGRRARELRAALADVDVLVDLHQTHRPIPPLAVLPASPGARALARRLGLSTAVEGAGLVYGEAMLADWVVAQGGEALTVELGKIGDPACVERGEALVRALVEGRDLDAAQVVWRIECALPAPGAGLRFLRPLDNGSPVRAGERLATSASGDVVAPADGAVFLPREDAPPGTPVALFARRVS
jgi:predicted deacylase